MKHHHHHNSHHGHQNYNPAQEMKHHKHLEHLAEAGALAAGAYAMHEKHQIKRDPQHAHRHKVAEEVAVTIAVGAAGFSLHEHHMGLLCKSEENVRSMEQEIAHLLRDHFTGFVRVREGTGVQVPSRGSGPVAKGAILGWRLLRLAHSLPRRSRFPCWLPGCEEC
ncbi:hypothetical protein Nepgr_008547 [Nepenthes gracilis]|uniref:Uncharacterized protein n=1 Tax=Nepenthes gracilis TaxID=150966 RepID=A0AAD3S9Q6_NEPGR|nr:hypothetical protein Nepgr_008547 [Nepenthes gracilis]